MLKRLTQPVRASALGSNTADQRTTRQLAPMQLALRIGYCVFGLLTILILWFALARPVQVLPRIRQTPAFTLTDQQARWYSERDLEGTQTLISFGYSHCSTECAVPDANAQAAYALLHTNGLLGTKVKLVTISLDSERDTPALLRSYAQRLGTTDPQSWRILTGAPADVKQLVGGTFGLYYSQRGEGIAFEPRMLLLDATGLIRAEYKGVLDLAILERDIGLIEREAQGSGLERPIYEAAHLFVCYPE